MKYLLFGRSGLRVSEICLGTMTFGEEWGWGASKEESRKQFELFAEKGGNFIDTANRYTEGTSERYVGEFVASERERFVVATKYTLYMRKGDVNSAGNHRKNLVQSVEASLKRLQMDYIDLLWLHMWEFTTPVDEVMRSLDDLVRAGKVLYVGISDTPAWVVSQANTLADLRGWTPFVGLQIEYSLIQRAPERELLPMARALDIAVTPWAALGGGALTGKYLKDKANASEPKRIAPESKRLSDANVRIAEEVARIAGEIERMPSQVALNWVRQRNQVVIPIVGARTAAQLEENLGCLDFELTPVQMQRLDEISAIELGFPHDFLATPAIQDLLFAGMQTRLKNHRQGG
jgi:aryl-alcohol dehydrogenase-like predicted oxidoreductase